MPQGTRFAFFCLLSRGSTSVTANLNVHVLSEQKESLSGNCCVMTKYQYVPEILEGKLENGRWDTSPLKLHSLNYTLYPMIRAFQTVCELKIRVLISDIHILKIRLENP